MNTKIKNIVFDVGMVLIDFCWQEPCKKLGFSDKIMEAFDQNMINSKYWNMLDEGTISTEEAIDGFIKEIPQYEKEIRLFWEHPEHFVKEYDYAEPLIRKLKEEGYQVYLLSNYPYDLYRLHWPSFRFFQLVDGYIVSAKHKIAKPDTTVYQLLCDKYRLIPEECVFIDDRQINVDAAISVGMAGIWFTGYEMLKKYLGNLNR